MLRYYGLEDKYDTVKDWYDGYRFGNVDVYCPWDVINYCYELLWDPSARPQNYWSNTSGNDTIRHFIEQLDNGLTKSELEALTAGETVTKEIHEELTYSELYESMDNLWSVLFMTGYLTCRSITEDGRYVLSIPNREIRNIFERQIMAMFKNNVRKDAATLNEFCNALKTGDAAKTEQLFTAYLGRTISKRDTFVRKEKKENFYQGILLGILGLKGGWSVKSNEESGEGYSDILIRVENEGIGIAIEVKYAENAGFDVACQEGLDQIERMNYAQELYDDDYRIVYKYAIACFKKRCRVMCEKETCDEEQKEKQP